MTTVPEVLIRLAEVKELILNYGWIDGSQHKQWVIDQALRKVCGSDYEEVIKEFEEANEGSYWDEGTPP